MLFCCGKTKQKQKQHYCVLGVLKFSLFQFVWVKEEKMKRDGAWMEVYKEKRINPRGPSFQGWRGRKLLHQENKDKKIGCDNRV